jgi:SAM-dependent methyltransferase
MNFNLFSEDEIQDVYSKHVVKSESYFNRLSPVPLHLNNKKWKWEGKDFPRVPCLLDFQIWIEKYQIDNIDQLLITGKDDPELEFLNYKNVDYVPYDGHNGDFHTLNLSKEYDFVLFSQTIEHLYNPFISMKNIFNHVKKGGYMFTSVPVLNIPHMVPVHFNGYTPTGLGMLMKSVGFNILEIGYWGNKQYINHIFQHHNWPGYEELMGENKCITHEKNNEVQTWILVQK